MLRLLKRAAIAACALILGLGIYLGGCNDLSVKPVPAKDYTVYFYDAIHNEGNWYFTYHPISNSIDSVWLPYESYPVISADGKEMYIWNQVDDMIDVLELDSFTLIDQLPYRAPEAVSPDNRLMAVHGEGLHILRTSDYSVLFSDTSLGGGVFSSNGQTFYGLPTAGGILRIDLTDSLFPTTRFSLPFGAVRHIRPSKDETRLFLYLHRGGFNSYFAVYDIASDSLIFTEYLWPGFGKLEITPDGRYVFYTNPGTMLGSTPGTPWITVYDVGKNEIHKRISTAGLLDEPDQYGMPLDEICITPDGRWLVALPAKSFPFIFTVDIRTMTITKYLRFFQRLMEGLACQNAP
jgi:DNA-binding beta-propeller fold protein YncE